MRFFTIVRRLTFSLIVAITVAVAVFVITAVVLGRRLIICVPFVLVEGVSVCDQLIPFLLWPFVILLFDFQEFLDGNVRAVLDQVLEIDIILGF